MVYRQRAGATGCWVVGGGQRSRGSCRKRPEAWEWGAVKVGSVNKLGGWFRSNFALPGRTVGDDLLVGSADEVPPHDDLLTQWFPTQDEHADRGDPRLHNHAGLTGGQIGKMIHRQRGAVEKQVPGIEQHSVLEGRVQVQFQRPAGTDRCLCAEQRRGVSVHRGGGAGQRTEENSHFSRSQPHRLRSVMLEHGGHVAGGVR